MCVYLHIYIYMHVNLGSYGGFIHGLLTCAILTLFLRLGARLVGGTSAVSKPPKQVTSSPDLSTDESESLYDLRSIPELRGFGVGSKSVCSYQL